MTNKVTTPVNIMYCTCCVYCILHMAIAQIWSTLEPQQKNHVWTSSISWESKAIPFKPPFTIVPFNTAGYVSLGKPI